MTGPCQQRAAGRVCSLFSQRKCVTAKCLSVEDDSIQAFTLALAEQKQRGGGNVALFVSLLVCVSVCAQYVCALLSLAAPPPPPLPLSLTPFPPPRLPFLSSPSSSTFHYWRFWLHFRLKRGGGRRGEEPARSGTGETELWDERYRIEGAGQREREAGEGRRREADKPLGKYIIRPLPSSGAPTDGSGWAPTIPVTLQVSWRKAALIKLSPGLRRMMAGSDAQNKPFAPSASSACSLQPPYTFFHFLSTHCIPVFPDSVSCAVGVAFSALFFFFLHQNLVLDALNRAEFVFGPSLM